MVNDIIYRLKLYISLANRVFSESSIKPLSKFKMIHFIFLSHGIFDKQLHI